MEPEDLLNAKEQLEQAFQKDFEGRRHVGNADALYRAVSAILDHLGRKGGEAKPNEPKEEPKKKEK
jgi:hypothetical protein